jgi:hypothetical protein
VRSLRRADSIALVGVAWGGVVLGHLLTYFLVYPSSPARAGHLADTGHGSFELAILSLVAAVPLALGLMTRRALGSRWTFSTKGTLISLAGIQLAAFALLEYAERHFSLTAALSDPAVQLGLAVQVLIAALLTVALALFVRVVRLVVARLRPLPVSRREAKRLLHREDPFTRAVFLNAIRLRAPPPSLA